MNFLCDFQTHIDAKALRNKQFPYYNDLHLLFGNRGTKKGANNDELDDDDDDKVFDVDDDNATRNLMVRDSLDDDDEREDYEGSYGKEDEPRSDDNNGVGDNSLIKKRKWREGVQYGLINPNLMMRIAGQMPQKTNSVLQPLEF